ncbi:hypothetical protein UA08_06603 [Talaromyces atroroseus]|uniref:Large ribosomal subunit protein mL67 n=1 Tax=Talaromyces atroroseus TaxID=1441469 RepID=A0A225AUH4_TALAT|nr:hypothetical protein UA08_06603 [Talaromyces atroroseus]OKL58065.1 hypothetical protein UA08_06603 [Talaromyces atroroseus]
MPTRQPTQRIAKFFDYMRKNERLDDFTIRDKALDSTKIPAWHLVRHPPVPESTVIQGKPRSPYSKAYRTFQKQEGARLRKALNRLTHGRNIFVYNNIRTNQVVYSLTRYLEKNNVLSQMVFHGKKTVPATLRKDMWAPFYSVHFDDAKVGLRAYQLLREFSLQRQLAPPKEMITITEKWLDQKRPRDMMEAEKWEEENKMNEKVGWMMNKKDRARVLMDQKATSVADIAAVLEIQEKELEEGFALGTRGYLTRKARQRRRLGRKLEAEATERATERVQKFEDQLEDLAGVSIENPTGHNEYSVESKQVKILWTDIYDAQYAKSWPERVSHGHLALLHDHVMPGQKRVEGAEVDEGDDILAHDNFTEKESVPSTSS